jgi:type III restriction enzyme
MKLRFKHQKFQEDACNAVCDVFSGQPSQTRQYLIDQGASAQTRAFNSGWGNAEVKLRTDDILKNLHAVQKQWGIITANKLETMRSKVEWDDGRKEIVERPVFTVEMETGTGKTYTYPKVLK